MGRALTWNLVCGGAGSTDIVPTTVVYNNDEILVMPLLTNLLMLIFKTSRIYEENEINFEMKHLHFATIVTSFCEVTVRAVLQYFRLAEIPHYIEVEQVL